MKKYLILHNIRSVYNVGAIFRTADAIGIARIYLTGYTPSPLDRFGRPRNDFAKAALGAEKTIAWESQKIPVSLIKKLKKEGFLIVGVEQDRQAIDYKKFKVPKKTAVLLGNEVKGVSPALRKNCDCLIEIPMKGKKESLNVSVAAGVVLYQLFDK